MESRDLPELVKATFGGGGRLRVKTLTHAPLLQIDHNAFRPVSASARPFDRAHSILRFASQNYDYKSRNPDPDPRLSGGLGQQ